MSATLAVSAVRQRIAAVVEALASPAAWTESGWPYGAFPAAEPGQDAHLTFAVGVPSTSFATHIETSRTTRAANGGAAHTDVRVAWLFALASDGEVSDVDGALDAEQLLITALVGTAHTSGLHVYVEGATRQVVGDGTYLLGEVRLATTHRIAIQ